MLQVRTGTRKVPMWAWVRNSAGENVSADGSGTWKYVRR